MVNNTQDPSVRSIAHLLQRSVGLNSAELVQCRKVGEEMGVKGQENLEQNSFGHGARYLFIIMLLEETVIAGELALEECMDL